MSYTATGTDSRDYGDARRHNALSLIFLLLTLCAFTVRFFIAPEVMNLFVHYTLDGGSFLEKLHIGTYLIYLLVPVMLFSRPFYLEGDDIRRFKDLLRFIAMVTPLILFLLVTGRTNAAGLFLDNYVVAGAAGLIMLAMNRDMRRIVGDWVLIMNLVSAVLGIVEFVTRQRLVYYHFEEEFFRPTALTDHPLTFGMTCGASIAFIAMTRWKLWVKLATMFLLVVATVASGARFALLLTVVEIFALVVFVPWTSLTRRHERRAKLAVFLMILAGGALLFAVLGAAGALTRFSGGIVDANFYARTDIYAIFGLVSWQDIVFGADLIEILEIINTKLGLPYIESSPVYLTFLIGAPLAAAVFALLFWLFWRLLKNVALPAWIGIGVFFGAALSNNMLSSKTPVIAMFVVLILAYAHFKPQPRVEG